MSNTAEPKKGLSVQRLLPVVAIIVIAGIGYWKFGDVLSFERLGENRGDLLAWRDANFILASVAFLLAYICVVAFSLPGAAVLSLSGGFLFGLFPGTLYNMLGATIGAIGIFWAVKLGLGDYLHQKFLADDGDGQDRLLERMDREIKANEISYLFLLRLVPVIPFFIANLAPAFLGVRFRNYALTTFIGIFPGALVYTSIGAGLGDVFAAGEVPNLGVIFEWHVLGPILGLCALAILPIVIKKFRGEPA